MAVTREEAIAVWLSRGYSRQEAKALTFGDPGGVDELQTLRAENKRLRALYEELLRNRPIGTKIAFSMVDDAQKRLHDAKRRFRKTRRAR